jgi:hypothetical protein
VGWGPKGLVKRRAATQNTHRPPQSFEAASTASKPQYVRHLTKPRTAADRLSRAGRISRCKGRNRIACRDVPDDAQIMKRAPIPDIVERLLDGADEIDCMSKPEVQELLRAAALDIEARRKMADIREGIMLEERPHQHQRMIGGALANASH